MGAPMLDEAADLLIVAAATWRHVLKCTTLSFPLSPSLYLPSSLLPAARLYQFRSQICSFLGELFALG